MDGVGVCSELTVEVMSDEQTSQTYLTPPSVPRDAVFFLMRPMARDCLRNQTRSGRSLEGRGARRGCASEIAVDGS